MVQGSPMHIVNFHGGLLDGSVAYKTPAQVGGMQVRFYMRLRSTS